MIRCTFYYPMIGFINLFIHVLRFPGSPSARSDIALLEVIAGHFAQMEFITNSELSFPFARNVAALARNTVDKVSRVVSQDPTMQKDDQFFDSQHGELSFQVCEIPRIFVLPGLNDWKEPFYYSNEDFDLDDWGVFSSTILGDSVLDPIISFTPT